MNKKISVIMLLFSILFFLTTSSFATNLANTALESFNKTAGAIQNAGQAVGDTVNSAGQGMQDAAGYVGDNVRNLTNNAATMRTTTTNKDVSTGNTGYAATRTAAGFTNTMTTWVWVVIGVAVVTIIALTWYYVSERNTSNRRSDS